MAAGRDHVPDRLRLAVSLQLFAGWRSRPRAARRVAAGRHDAKRHRRKRPALPPARHLPRLAPRTAIRQRFRRRDGDPHRGNALLCDRIRPALRDPAGREPCGLCLQHRGRIRRRLPCACARAHAPAPAFLALRGLPAPSRRRGAALVMDRLPSRAIRAGPGYRRVGVKLCAARSRRLAGARRVHNATCSPG